MYQVECVFLLMILHGVFSVVIYTSLPGRGYLW